MKNSHRLFLVILLCLAVIIRIHPSIPANAQSATATPLQCGDIIDGETTTAEPIFSYELQVRAGTILNIRVEPIGSTFNVVVQFYDAGNQKFGDFNANLAGLAEEIDDYSIGTSNPIMRVGGLGPEVYNTFYIGSYVGAFTIYFGCTLRDGTVILPGDTPSNGGSGNGGSTLPPFSGYGFPGLNPVDFAAAFRLPLSPNAANPGEIPPVGDAILGFYFNGNAGDVLALSFERTSGNLNLGLVVLSSDNKVAFMSALVSSTTLATQFTLPSTGEYTIGIFRLDLIPPAAPEPTRFTVQATLNP